MQALWMIVAGFCFACTGVCVKLAANLFSASEIVFYRCAISLVLVLALVRLRNVAIVTRHWRFQMLRAASGFAAMLLSFYAIMMLPLATAMTLTYSSPLFLAVYLAWFGKIPLRASMVGALAIGLAGVALLLRPTIGAEQMLGGIVGLGSGAMAGVAYFNIRELGARGEVEERTVFYFSLFATLASGLWMALDDFHAVDLWGAVLLLGVGGFATLAQLAMTRAYKRGKTFVVASLTYSAVVFASLFGVAIWHEALTASAVLAIALIVSSGILASRFSGQVQQVQRDVKLCPSEPSEQT